MNFLENVPQPELVTNKSAWAGHLRFGIWLAQQLQPRIILELGVYHGDSLAAFMQGAAKTALGIGVDLWEYGQNEDGNRTYDQLRMYLDERYRGRIALLRMAFDQAQPLVNLLGIDLLHIDGNHDYQSIEHDYRTWIEKVSYRGLVLLHDVNTPPEWEPAFGGTRWWNDHRGSGPSLFFPHSHGLGIISPHGVPFPPWLQELADAKTSELHSYVENAGKPR